MNDGILIIEDDPQVATMTSEFLLHHGYREVAVANSAEEAMAYLSKHSVSLVLLDIYLPGASGLDVLRNIRREQEQIEAIIVSAAKDSAQIREAFRFGCIDYLLKPFTYERLSEALDKFQQRSSLLKKERLSQTELDMLAGDLGASAPSDASSLPKGIDLNTLNRICREIKTQKEAFCVQDIADVLALSRVTVKKYLDFLAEEKILRKTYIYGNIGRPLHEYRLTTDPVAKKQFFHWSV